MKLFEVYVTITSEASMIVYADDAQQAKEKAQALIDEGVGDLEEVGMGDQTADEAHETKDYDAFKKQADTNEEAWNDLEANKDQE